MLIILREGVFLFTSIVFQYLLLEKSYSRKKTLAFLIPCVSLVFLLNALFLINQNFILFFRFYPLAVILPVSILFFSLSKYKGFKVLFNILTAAFLGIVMRISGYLFSSLFAYSDVSSIIGQILAFPIILYLLLKVFRPPYMQILNQLKSVWSNLCLFLLAMIVLIYVLDWYPVNITGSPASVLSVLIAIFAIFLFYSVVCTFFRQMQQHFTMQNKQNLLKMNIAALQSQLISDKACQEKLKIMQHDIHHHTQIISSLIAGGYTNKTLEYISKFNAFLDDTKFRVYCENPTINAILGYYIENAKNEGIAVKTRLDIPVKIHVDEIELATVFANAIENARNACRQMPPEAKPAIELICVNKQDFIFECSNTYVGVIEFDEKGLPVSRMDEHGIGSKSIAAFAQRHNAILDYQADGNVFRIRILIPKLTVEKISKTG